MVSSKIKHEWLVDVYFDLACYASKNAMPELLRHVVIALPILECEIGGSPKLRELEKLLRNKPLTLSEIQVGPTLSDKSAECQSFPFPEQTYPATSLTGVPSAVKPFRTATRTWNSAT